MRFDADLQDAFDVESLWRTDRDNKLPQMPWQAHVRLAPARWLAIVSSKARSSSDRGRGSR